MDLRKDLEDHYVSGTGIPFHADGYATLEDTLARIDLINMPFAKNMEKEWSNKFWAYYQPKTTLLSFSLNTESENFEDFLYKLYKHKISDDNLKQNFPFNFSYATSKSESSLIGGLIHELGSFTSYVYGDITLYEDGKWIFHGYKNIYDYWNFDQKQDVPVYDLFAEGRNIATYLKHKELRQRREEENKKIDRLIQVKPFIVQFSSDRVHNQEGYITRGDVNISDIQIEHLDTSRSSFIQHAAYDKTHEEVIITINNRQYTYPLSLGVWERFKQAASFGTFFDQNIKP